MVIRKLLVALSAIFPSFLLSGCVTTQNISKATIEPVFASQTARNTVQRYVVLDSRTTSLDADRRRVEVVDVSCKLIGTGFQLAYTTPANVKIPVYGPRSSDLTMVCQYKGDRYTKNIPVFNETRDDIENAGAQGGFLGSIIMMTYAETRGDKADDVYTYRKPHLHLKK